MSIKNSLREKKKLEREFGNKIPIEKNVLKKELAKSVR